MLTLRNLELDDLELVSRWLIEPHVSRWFLAQSSLESELADLHDSIVGEQPTMALLAAVDHQPIGWCQWYLCSDYPDHAAGVGALAADVGIDYAIGEPARVNRGVGTQLIGGLVRWVRERRPDAAIIADPNARNVASRRVLEKNGFRLVAERPVPSEPTVEPMAIYRLDEAGGS